MVERLLKCPECGNTDPACFRVYAQVAFIVEDDGSLSVSDQDFGVVGECDDDMIECLGDDEECGHEAKGREFL